MTSTLEVLLAQLRDGTADATVLARARALVSNDERIPPDLREVVLTDPAEAADDAVGLLAVLGVDDLGQQLADAIRSETEAPSQPLELDDGWGEIGAALREGLLAEAGEVELASAVMRRLPLVDFAWGPVLADAVQGEAGALDVSDRVLEAVDARSARQAPVAGAVLAEAGEVDLADGVLAALGLLTIPVRDAVRAECGSAEVADRVMEKIHAADAMRSAQGRAAPAPAPIPLGSSAAGPLPVPRAANNVRRFGFGVGALALAAAAALLSVFVGSPGPQPDASMLFASAGDVVIEDLSSSDDVSVIQLEGDDGAVILWIDEEAG